MDGTIKKSKKLKVIAILLIAVLLMALLPLMSLGEDSNAKNISDKVNINNVRIDAYALKPDSTWQKDWQEFIKNGQYSDTLANYVVTAEESLRVYFDWAIAEEDMLSVNAGDYFELEIEKGVLALQAAKAVDIFAEIVEEVDGNKVVSEVAVGTLKTDVTNNKLIVTLNKAGASAMELKDGWVLGVVKVAKDVDGEVTTVIDGKTVTFNTKPKEESGETVEGGKIWEKGNPNELVKSGWISESNKTAEFTLEVNGDALYNKLRNASYNPEVRENVIVEDKLPSNLKFRTDVDPVSIYVPYYLMMGDTEHGKTATGQISSECFTTVSIKDSFTKINTDGLTVDQFEAQIKSTPYTYGIYDNSYFLANMGDMPSQGLMMPLSGSAIEAKVSAYAKSTESRKANTLSAYAGVYGSQEYVPALAVKVTLRTNYVGFGGEDDQARNEAKMYWGDTGYKGSVSTKEFTAYAGGVKLGQRYSVTINKIDGDTEQKLDGVSFRLQKFNEDNNTYENYKSLYEDEIKVTSDGAVVFTGLSVGKYKVVEEKGLEGYTNVVKFKDKNGEDTDGTFEISDSDKGTIWVNVENFKEKVEGETATSVAIQDDSSVLGQEEIPDSEDGTVLGDEAKTSDAMNMVPLLILIGAVALILVLVALQSRGSKE